MSRGRTPAIGRSSKVTATSSAALDGPWAPAPAASANARHSASALVARPTRPSCPLISEVLHLIFLHVAVVFVERSRELVRTVVAADEVQVVGVGRMDGCFERCAAWRGDRTRRQPRIAVG